MSAAAAGCRYRLTRGDEADSVGLAAQVEEEPKTLRDVHIEEALGDEVAVQVEVQVAVEVVEAKAQLVGQRQTARSSGGDNRCCCVVTLMLLLLLLLLTLATSGGRLADCLTQVLVHDPVLGAIDQLVRVVGQVDASVERVRRARGAADGERGARLARTRVDAHYLQAEELALLDRLVQKHVGVACRR